MSLLEILESLDKRKENIDDFGNINMKVFYPSGSNIELSKPDLKFKIKNFFKMQNYFCFRRKEKNLTEKFFKSNY